MSPRSTLRVSGGHKSVQLDRLVRSERLRTIARLEGVLPVQEAEDAYQDACVRALDRLSQQTSELGVCLASLPRPCGMTCLLVHHHWRLAKCCCLRQHPMIMDASARSW